MKSPAIWIAGGFAVVLVCAVSGLIALRSMPEMGPGTSAEQYAYRKVDKETAPSTKLWQTPKFTFSNQHGAKVSEGDLAGHVWIADFIYTTCTSVCPAITAKMALLQRRLSDERLRFVSFSVDPEHDTQEALALYAKSWRPEEKRWLLLRTENDSLTRFAQGMRVATEATSDPVNPILHSSMFFLVDAKGEVRGVYDSGDNVALDRLFKDAQQLQSSAGTAQSTAGQAQSGQAQSGQALFAAMGCNACHQNDKVAPSLLGLLGRTVKFASGATAVADNAYIRQSIVAPGSQMVAGYLGLMPSYQDQLSPGELDELVHYVAELRQAPVANAATTASGSTSVPTPVPVATPSAEPASASQIELTTDPVCKMSVRITPDAPHAEFAGKSYHFCSPTCRDRFVKNPQQYATAH